MNPTAFASLAVLVAYLIGAIPFAYVFVRAIKGVDIRTVGSGNVGATNAARVLGLRGFLLVFLCDGLKGLLPTLLLPWWVRHRTGLPFPELPVFVALAAILGHNFPVYLGFRGGKGVSTSLGAAIGLDPLSSVAAVLAFGIALRASRYVSLASMIGACVFAVAHFGLVLFYEHKSAWDREHFALSALILGLLAMMLVRHRKNWARIREGTEPKVGRKRQPPAGRSCAALLIVLVVGGVGALLAGRVLRTATLDCGPFTLEALSRTRTSHQRATSPVFVEGGRTLAVLCPRYERLMLYSVVEGRTLRLRADVTLEGQPVALKADGDRLWVLHRPLGDRRHVEPGFLRAYRADGSPEGPRIVVGFYPTGLALLEEGRKAAVVSSGRSEGSADRGTPALEVVDLEAGRVGARVEFDRPGEWPSRIAVADSGRAAAVALKGSNQVAAIDLQDAGHPALLGRSPLAPLRLPYPSLADGDCILMPVDSPAECAILASGGEFLVGVTPESSDLEVRRLLSKRPLGTLPLRGAANLGEVRPTGVACSPDGTLVAITSRSGAVHLVGVRTKPAVGSPREVASR